MPPSLFFCEKVREKWKHDFYGSGYTNNNLEFTLRPGQPHASGAEEDVQGAAMFYTPFWVFLAVAVSLAVAAVYYRRFTIIDLQIAITVIAFSMSFDMLACKQFRLYHYVDPSLQFVGWYSFWANFFICPSLGLVFIKFLPGRPRWQVFYILGWGAFFTLFEQYVSKPYGIVHYMAWKIFPWSTVGYIAAFTLETLYYRMLNRYLCASRKRG